MLDCFPEAASVFCDLAKCNVDDRVGDSLQKIIVVRNDHETSFKTVQIIDQPLYMLRIKVVRRFVQQQDIRLFKQEFGQNDFRTLSAGTFADLPIASQRIDSKPAHDLIDFRLNPVKVVCFKNFLTASGLFKQRIIYFFGIFFIIPRLSFLNFK